MSLDDVTDPIASAVATLIKGSVNAKLHPILGEDPIVKVFGAPLPVVSIPHQDLPAITLWRFQDAGQALDDYSFESRTTFRLDYYAAATPIERIQTRWALLTKVWE